EDPAINRKYLEKAEHAIERMISIVNDLETISRLEHGRLTLQKTSFDIVSLTRNVFDVLEEKAGNKSIRMFFKEGSEKPVFVYADQERIRQVLVNLVVNSINYGQENGYVRLAFYDMDEHILVEVKDDGIGIGEEHIGRIFERFYRVDKGRSMKSGGTGLGLSIVKHIIEAHNQTINVRSDPGKGTTITFTLKIKE
ncbi:MAG: sensor histidine kinase, partial [Bacteroidetes bacterium]|nr:sensor histidine kinase [Bacteroidota bacterium]